MNSDYFIVNGGNDYDFNTTRDILGNRSIISLFEYKYGYKKTLVKKGSVRPGFLSYIHSQNKQVWHKL